MQLDFVFSYSAFLPLLELYIDHTVTDGAAAILSSKHVGPLNHGYYHLQLLIT